MLKWQNVVECVIYLDDIVIFAKDWQTCWSRTLRCLESLCKAGFALNIVKIKFLVDEINLLGHHIVNGMCTPNPKN